MEVGALRFQVVKCPCRAFTACTSYCEFTYQYWQSQQNQENIRVKSESNAAPPYFPAIYGNFHTFPSPMVASCRDQDKSQRDPKVSRSFKSSPLFSFHFIVPGSCTFQALFLLERNKRTGYIQPFFIFFPISYCNAPTLLCQRFYVMEI